MYIISNYYIYENIYLIINHLKTNKNNFKRKIINKITILKKNKNKI
jgi:hypothetical protein